MTHAPSFSLFGKRALVTGAGRGIGRASALALAAMGADVTLAARTLDDLNEVLLEITKSGGQGQVMVLDAANIDAVQSAIEAEKGFDIFFNNAGTNRPANFVDVRLEDYDAVIDLNIRGAFFAAQAVAKAMIRDRISGSIINMSSQMGHVGGAKRTVYCASKHAIEGLSKAMAVDLAPHRIRVNTVCPTFIETPMTTPFLADPAFKADVVDKILIGRVGQVSDITGAVVYLASDASQLVTGSSMMIDGGWTTV